MRVTPPLELEAGRIRDDQKYLSRTGDMHGMFCLLRNGAELRIISSGRDRKYGWEHVSVSLADRTPTWDEMCIIKDLFWTENECVVQYHPAKIHYVNYHPYCLHLWRPLHSRLPIPPSNLVGPKNKVSHA